MALTPAQRDLLAICALGQDRKTLDWNLVARTCQSPDLLAIVLGGTAPADAGRRTFPR